MNELLKLFIDKMPNKEADEALVVMTCKSMSEKLTKKRNEGMCGWHNTSRNKYLLEMLISHVEKGDMIDVINFAAMIHARSELYGKEA